MLLPAFDLEYKQYVLLGYLQRVRGHFKERRLFPHLKQVQEQLDAAMDLRHRKDELARHIPGELLGFDPATGQAMHAQGPDPWPLELIDQLIGMAIPGLRQALDEGTALRGTLADGIQLIPVGLQPLDPMAGWLLLRSGQEARIYSFHVPWVRSSTARHGEDMLVTQYVCTTAVGLHRTYEVLRSELMRRSDAPVVPATFALETAGRLPYLETYVPLARHLVYEHLCALR